VVKTTEGFELIDQIEQDLAGGRPVSPHAAGHLLAIDEVVSTHTELESLTPKEREVVVLIARGHFLLSRGFIGLTPLFPPH
jgi:DNA-binding NarL/FixJ family response regulator